jgi:hypothetical protein
MRLPWLALSSPQTHHVLNTYGDFQVASSTLREGGQIFERQTAIERFVDAFHFVGWDVTGGSAVLKSCIGFCLGWRLPKDSPSVSGYFAIRL